MSEFSINVTAVKFSERDWNLQPVSNFMSAVGNYNRGYIFQARTEVEIITIYFSHSSHLGYLWAAYLNDS